MTEGNTLKVTQADRDAAADYHRTKLGTLAHIRCRIREGSRDSDHVVQLLASYRHRIEATRPDTSLAPGSGDRNAVLEEAIERLKLRSALYGGEPLTRNERAIADHMIAGVEELKSTPPEPVNDAGTEELVEGAVMDVRRTSQGLEIIPNCLTPTCRFCGEENHYGTCAEMRAEQQRNDPERGRPVPIVRSGP